MLKKKQFKAAVKINASPARLLGDGVINDVIKAVSTIREEHIDTHGNEHCVKYRPIPRRIAGEEAFKKIMTSPL